MKHRVRITAAFRKDLRGHLSWLDGVDEEGWIEGLRTGLDEAVALLGEHPGAGALEGKGEDGAELRRLILRRVPYVVWYAAAAPAAAATDVWLLRLFHARQWRPAPSWPPALERRRGRRRRARAGR